MLKLVIPGGELYDEEHNEFKTQKPQTLQLEHSLVSISKWESKWMKPFLINEKKTPEEFLDYVKCMTITQNVPDEVYANIKKSQIKEIKDYIDSPQTATTFSKTNKRGGAREIITSEVIYSWMVDLNVPPEYQKWHLNRLLTLIEVLNRRHAPQQKMSNREILRQQYALNQQRRQQFNTRG